MWTPRSLCWHPTTFSNTCKQCWTSQRESSSSRPSARPFPCIASQAISPSRSPTSVQARTRVRRGTSSHGIPVGMIRSRSLCCFQPRKTQQLRGPKFRQSPRMLSRPAPQWAVAWRMIVIRLMSLEWTCLRYMSMMVKRGLAHRVWLTLRLRQEEWIDQRKDVGKAPIHNSHTCVHPGWKRWQQVRQVRIMSEVQPEASVVRQAAGLAGRWARAFAQIFFAGALICGDLAHQHDLLPQVQTGSPSHADSKVFTSSFHEQFEQATSSYSSASPSGHRRDGPLPGHDGGGRRDGLHRDLQRRGLGTASRCTIAPGVKKRLIGKVNNALHAITKEYQIYQMNSLYCKSRADIMEAFAGSAKISKMSSAYMDSRR